MSGFAPLHKQLPSVDGKVNNFVHGYGIGRYRGGEGLLNRYIEKEVKTLLCLVHDTLVRILDSLTHFGISREVSDLL